MAWPPRTPCPVGGPAGVGVVVRWCSQPARVAASSAVCVGTERVARRRALGARFVEILPPPVMDPAGAHAFWSHLSGLARDPWQHLRSGQPHVAFEIHAEPARLGIVLRNT
jgi:hypothetical protein